MSDSVGRAVGMCLQADDKGLLQGDTCLTRTVAMAIVRQHESWVNAKKNEQRVKHADDLLELYIKLNFPKVYEDLERKRLAEKESIPTFDGMEADSMDDMLDKLRAVAGML